MTKPNYVRIVTTGDDEPMKLLFDDGNGNRYQIRLEAVKPLAEALIAAGAALAQFCEPIEEKETL